MAHQELGPFYLQGITTAARDALVDLVPSLTIFNVETMRWEMWDGFQWAAHMTDASDTTLFRTIVDAAFASEGPVLFHTLAAALRDADPVSIFMRSAGDIAGVTITSGHDLRRLVGESSDRSDPGVAITVSKNGVTLEQLHIGTDTLTVGGATNGNTVKDCLVSGAGALLFPAGFGGYALVSGVRFDAVSAAVALQFQQIEGIVTDCRFFSPAAGATNYILLGTSAAINAPVITKGVFIGGASLPSGYAIEVSGSGSITAPLISHSRFVSIANGAIHMKNSLGGTIAHCFLDGVGGATALVEVEPKAGQQCYVTIDTCEFNDAGLILTFTGADADFIGTRVQNSSFRGGGTVEVGANTLWNNNDFGDATIDFQSKTGIVVIGGDMTGATLENIPADIVFRSVKGQADRPANILFTADNELTISSGAITVTQSHHTIDTESDAATDELNTINGLTANQLYFFYPAHTDRTVVLKHNTGNLLCIGNQDFSLNDAHDFIWAFSPDGSTVYVGGSHNAPVFISDTEPTSKQDGQLWLDTGATGTGGLGILTVATITSSDTLTTSHTVVLCDATSGAITVTLPAASGNDGRHYHIKKIDSSGNAITIDGNGSETIDGETTQVISVQYNSLNIVCDGSVWHIL